MNVGVEKISTGFKANKLTLNLTKTKWTIFHTQKENHFIEND